ncbi:hypothetical protein D3C77_336530 [compost metagenome]
MVHVPLLKSAPRKEGEYKTIADAAGDLCHFYGDFSGYHIYMIATTYKKRIVKDSLNYHDKKNGLFSLLLEVTLSNGNIQQVEVNDCKCPLFQVDSLGVRFPDKISVEAFSPGTPDSLKFHFGDQQPKFRFSSSLIPELPASIRHETSEICDLKIEYIGKSVGDGSREIADRLGDGHSTETAILNELSYKKTNLDAYAILYKPGELTIGEYGPASVAISFPDIVDILEKSLISQFLPEKNQKSRNFPNDMSKPAKQLADLGVRNLHVTAKSPLNYGLLFTDEIERQKTHNFNIRIPSFR